MATYQGDWNTRKSDEEGYAYTAFKKFFGREPTDLELAQATAGYQSGDPNKPNVQGGDAFVAQMYQQMNPNADNLKKAGEKYADVDAMFNQYVGRAATQDEKDHFGAMLASGQFTNYQIADVLKNLPENVRAEDEKFRKTLSTELQKGDERYFKENIMPSIQSQFAKQGRTVDATGFQNALAREATGQNREREQFLSQLTANQYEGNKANAFADYVGNRDYTRGRSDMLADRNAMRLYEISNYAMQKQAYDEYLRKYGKRSGGGAAGAASGAMSGAATGATVGSVFPGIGTAIGAGIGTLVGGTAGYFAGR